MSLANWKGGSQQISGCLIWINDKDETTTTTTRHHQSLQQPKVLCEPSNKRGSRRRQCETVPASGYQHDRAILEDFSSG